MSRIPILAAITLCAVVAAAAARIPSPPTTSSTGVYPEAKFQRVQLECRNMTPTGSCPSPRAQCKQACFEVYEEDVFGCLTGAEGILDWQRALCYANASVRLGSCNSRCNQDHPF